MKDGYKIVDVDSHMMEPDWLWERHIEDRYKTAAKAMERFKRASSTGFSPQSRLQDMDEQGVDVQILYPTFAGQMLGRRFNDAELLAACCRAYNNWTNEYCSANPQRLRPAA